MDRSVIPRINNTSVIDRYRISHNRPAIIAILYAAVKLDAAIHQLDYFARSEAELDFFVCEVDKVHPWPIEDGIRFVYVVDEVLFILLFQLFVRILFFFFLKVDVFS